MGPPRTDQRPARERGDGRVACVGPLQGGKWNVGSRCAAVRTCSWPSSGRIAEELTGCGARYGRHYGSRQEAPGRVRRSINEEATPSPTPLPSARPLVHVVSISREDALSCPRSASPSTVSAKRST